MTERWLFPAIISLCVSSCSPTADLGDSADQGDPVVYAVNYPLFYFASRIGGDLIDLRFPVDSVDPALWKPTDDQVSAIQSADALFLNGAGYAGWVDKVSLPASIKVDTSESFSDKLITIKTVATHSHGGEGEHSHDGLASVTWLDPSLAAAQASAVRDSLVEMLPEKEDDLNRRTNELLLELSDLDREWKAIGERLKGKKLIGSHPSYQYFARRYGLNVESVHWIPDQAPNEKAIAELKKILGFGPAQLMLWEADPVPKALQVLESFGIESVVFSPCGNRPSAGDWLSVMEQNAANLSAIVSQ